MNEEQHDYLLESAPETLTCCVTADPALNAELAEEALIDATGLNAAGRWIYTRSQFGQGYCFLGDLPQHFAYIPNYVRKMNNG